MATQISKKSLMAKARGFTVSFEKMDEKERSQQPSGKYAEDYNGLREIVKNQYPNLESLLPPTVTTFRGAGGENSYSYYDYCEINTFCEQIYQLLSEEE